MIVYTPASTQRPDPTLRPDEVLVEVEAAVVGAPEAAALDAGTSYAPGGAAVGAVTRAGDAATHLVGKRVLVGPIAACGECDVCRRGYPAGCAAHARPGLERDGALASHVVAKSRWVLALDGALDGATPGPAAAALPREAALAHEMLARAGVAPGETTLWLGSGAVADFGLALARDRGATALELTAGERGLPADELLASVRARAAALAAPQGPWRVFEVSGRAAWRRRAAALATPGSTLVAAASDEDGLAGALSRDLVVHTVAAAHPDLLPEVVALAVRGVLDLAAAVEIHPIAKLDDVLAALRRGQLSRLPIVTMA